MDALPTEASLKCNVYFWCTTYEGELTVLGYGSKKISGEVLHHYRMAR